MQRILVLFLILSAGSLWTGWSRLAARPNSAVEATGNLQTLDGNWEGVLEAGSAKLRLVLKIASGRDGSLKASLDSPDQGANDITIDEITLKGRALHFEMRDLSASYDGTLNSDGTEVLGAWKQATNTLPLLFHKAGAVRSTVTVQRGRVQLKSCANPALTKDALCGKYEVFEDRSAKTGRKIALNLMLLPAVNAKAAPDATFYLVGGPGAAATASATAGFMTRLRRDRDVVMVDQRGTGESNPLNCKFHGDKSDMQSYFGESFPIDKLRACRAELEKVADLKLYTTSIAMADLDEVRAALGYDKINVYGGSYGSTAALVYLREHPEHTRTTAVFGVAPPDMKIPLSFARGVQHAMDRLFEDCAADTACHEGFPKFREEFEAVLKQFDKGPVVVDMKNPYTGEAQHIKVTRDGFVDGVRLTLYVPNAMSVVPLIVHLAAKGDLAPLVSTAFQIGYQIYGQISVGMQFSVICGEDVPFITDAEVARESANSFYGDARVRPARQACAEWPRANVPASFLEPVKSNAPVLLVSGELDPVTPPWLAAAAARNFPNGRHLVIHYATHNSYECVEGIVAEFIDKGTAADLDTSCAEQIRRLPFNVPKTP
jgi:pimeloyl-ACP methyl ester carboxylesterase